MFFLFMDPDALPVFSPELQKVEMLLDRLREVEPGMPISEAATLVYLARRLRDLSLGEIKLKDVADEMGMPYSTLLRYTDGLSDGGKSTHKLELLEKGLHPTDRRARQIRLTPKGMELVSALEAIIIGVGQSKPTG